MKRHTLHTAILAGSDTSPDLGTGSLVFAVINEKTKSFDRYQTAYKYNSEGIRSLMVNRGETCLIKIQNDVVIDFEITPTVPTSNWVGELNWDDTTYLSNHGLKFSKNYQLILLELLTLTSN